MTQNHIRKTTAAMKAKLDEILSDYLGTDQRIEAGMHNDPDFFGSMRYYELQAKKADLGKAHNKLTDALVTIELYM